MASLLSYMVAMPGSSYAGALKSLTADEQLLVENLRRHVVAVASREHNLYNNPADLEVAARYVESTLSGLGYETFAQRFIAAGKAALAAADQKKPDGVFTAGGDLNETCDACHDKYQRR